MIENEVQHDFCNVVFKNLEMETIHQPYKQELKELHCIENGYIELLDETLAINYNNITQIKLSKSPLRNAINLGVVVVTLACRAAIRGGVDPEISFSLSDAYINKLDELDNIESVNKLMRQAQREYTKMVYEIKTTRKNLKNTNQNFHVEQCKNYVFSHLHDKIRISEIAEELGLNPNYLSVLFRQYEGISIKEFILNEKITLVKKLLIHSHYSYIEIATYLSFSSQSHLEKQFKKLTGMTLRQYKEKYYINKIHY